MASTGITIGRLAKAANVGIETIRYYQRLGLLPTPVPIDSAFRHYPVEIVDRVQFIKRAQNLGFSLEEIASLLALNDGTDRTSIQRLASGRLTNIRSKIADLQRIEGMLAHLLHECEQTDHANACPIIAAFASDTEGTDTPSSH